MARGFWDEFWASFKKAQGALMAVLAPFCGFLFWLTKPDAVVGVPLVLGVSVFFVGLLATVTHMAYVMNKKAAGGLPKVVLARRNGTAPKAPLICLLDPCDMFSHGIDVSVYHVEDSSFEVLVAIGQVVNVQDDHRIVVSIRDVLKGQEDLLRKIEANEKATLSHLVVKPTVPSQAVVHQLGGIGSEY